MSYFRTSEDQEQFNADLDKKLANVVRKTKTRTIPVTNAMSAADFNAVMADIYRRTPIIPYGEVLSVQFADGTYNWTAEAEIPGFSGGGELHLLGNASEFSAGSSKSVFLDFSGGTSNGLTGYRNGVMIDVLGLKIRCPDTAGRVALRFWGGMTRVRCRFSYLLGVSTSNGIGLHATNGTNIVLIDNYFSNSLYGVLASNNAHIYMSNNYSLAGNYPAYGMVINGSNGVIGYAGTYPLGATAHWLVTTPGVLR